MHLSKITKKVIPRPIYRIYRRREFGRGLDETFNFFSGCVFDEIKLDVVDVKIFGAR